MFEQFRPDILETAVEELKQIIEDTKTKTEELLKNKPYTYNSFAKPLQIAAQKINEFFSPISQIHSVNNSEKTQEVFMASLPMLSEYSTEFSQREDIFNAYKEIYQNEKHILSPACRTVVEDSLLMFKLGGVDLPEEQKNRLKEINLKLSELSNNFSQNLINANNEFKMEVTSPEDVEGIPESDLAPLKTENGWCFTLHMPSFIAYMTYGKNRDLREKLYKAYTTRAPQNGRILEEILNLKDEKAKLLGFKNFAELSLETKSAPDVESVINFSKDLAEKSKAQGEQEADELRKYAEEDGIEIQSYDTAYYSEKLRQKVCGFDENIFRPYFKKEAVLQGLFTFINKLFSLEFVKTDEKLWDDKAESYDVFRNGELKARIYTDLEARQGKRDGAWMSEWQTRFTYPDGTIKLPSAMMTCNFPKSDGGTPSLLRHRDVVTLFHEAGHVLHHICSEIDEPDVSGINGVKWDTVEFPSQFLELFAYDGEVLKMFAKHYQTGETISDEMIEKLNSARHFQTAMGMLRQLEFGLFDMTIHKDKRTEDEVHEILQTIRKSTSLIAPPEYNRFQNGFAHIFAGGYSAGYYSYKWAERMSADAYEIFVNSGLFDKKTAEAFYLNVLSKGASEDPVELFKRFAGRDADNNALLRVNGIVA